MVVYETLTDLLRQISQMETADDISRVADAEEQFLLYATPQEAAQIRDAFRQRSTELLQESQRQSEESLKILTQHGFVLDTTQWLTIARYAKKYGVSTQSVTNWIARGVIPSECVKDIPELNDIRLVKDQPYR